MLQKDIEIIDKQFEYDDNWGVTDAWCRIKKALAEAQNSQQHTQAKMPTLEECQKEVQSRIWAGGFVGTSTNITEVVYNFICRHIVCA